MCLDRGTNMQFLSITFAIFLVITLTCYYIVPQKMRWGVLLVSGMIFYVWSVPYLVIYLLFSALTTYAYGRWASSHEKSGKGLLALVIGANLAVLLLLKFYLE